MATTPTNPHQRSQATQCLGTRLHYCHSEIKRSKSQQELCCVIDHKGKGCNRGIHRRLDVPSKYSEHSQTNTNLHYVEYSTERSGGPSKMIVFGLHAAPANAARAVKRRPSRPHRSTTGCDCKNSCRGMPTLAIKKTINNACVTTSINSRPAVI